MTGHSHSHRSKHYHSKMKPAPWKRSVKRKVAAFLANVNAGNEIIPVAEDCGASKKAKKEIIPTAEDSGASKKTKKKEIIPVAEDDGASKKGKEIIPVAEDDGASKKAGKEIIPVPEDDGASKRAGKEIIPVAEDDGASKKAKKEIILALEDGGPSKKTKREIFPVTEDDGASKKAGKQIISVVEDDGASKKAGKEIIPVAEDDGARKNTGKETVLVEEDVSGSKNGGKEISVVAEDGGKEVSVVAEGSKKRFQQIWSKEDEKEILKGLAEFASDTGLEPYRECDAFHEFLKKRKPSCADTSTSQLKEKIRRIKKKFVNHLAKSNSKLDRESIKLAHKVWPPEADKRKASAIAESALKMFGPMDDEFWKWAIQFLDRATMADLEQRWRKLRLAEIELKAKTAELIGEQTFAIVQALKSST